MKAKLKVFGLVISLLFLVFTAYGYGYYRGYHDRSRILTAVDLSFNEALYDDLQQNKLDTLRENLKVLISGGSESLRSLGKAPFNNFAYELSHSNAGDTSKELLKADEITKGMSFTPMP